MHFEEASTRALAVLIMFFFLRWVYSGFHCITWYLWNIFGISNTYHKLKLKSKYQNYGFCVSFSCCCFSVAMSDSVWPYGPQRPRLPCPSLPPGVYSNSNSSPLSWWWIISSSVTSSSSCPVFPSIRVFSNE